MAGIRTEGMVTGPFCEEMLVCHYSSDMSNSKGIFLGEDPFNFSVPLLMAYAILIVAISRVGHFILKPLGQGILTAQILAGIIMGPSVLGNDTTYAKKMFPPGAKTTIETIASVGFLLHLFLIGLQMDPRILKKAGKSAFIIGVAGFVLPYVLGELAFIVLHQVATIDRRLSLSLPFIIAMNSMSSFVVVANLLTDLNILNSELGRLATQTSMVTEMFSWFMATVMNTIGLIASQSNYMPLWSLLWLSLFLIAIVFVLRPLVIWISKHTPEGERMDEILFIVVLVMVLLCSFCAEIIGQHAAFGALVLGMALPDGPPVGTILVDKFETIISALLLPIFYALTGSRVRLASIGKPKIALMIEITIMLGYLGKFTGTIIPAMYSGVPFWESLCLALIMCCKGIIEVATFSVWRENKVLSSQAYTLLILSMLVVTGICRPIVAYLYDPSTTFMSFDRRSIFQPKQDMEFRILACIHREENVPPIINLLEVSHATKSSPISVVALCLMELIGSSTSVLESSDSRKKFASRLINPGHVIKAFSSYQHHNQGQVMVQHFTAIAPYSSMHTDICALAQEMRTNIVIVPYHKQWDCDGAVGATTASIRTVNNNVIDKAPCSVGILVDKAHIGGHRSVLSSQSLLHVALLFLGGPDDREALSYCKRMAGHQKISLTVVWFRRMDEHARVDENEEYLDEKMMNEFKATTVGKIIHKEEIVKDGVGTIQVIRSMKDDFDLFMVGRHHGNSPFTLGLTDWHESTELGLIGDMLATSDDQFSVLVVQQQPFGVGIQDLCPSFHANTDEANQDLDYSDDVCRKLGA